MKVKVIVPFRDKEFNDEIVRNVDDIFECSEELAKERIEKGFVEKVEEKSAKKGKKDEKSE